MRGLLSVGSMARRVSAGGDANEVGGWHMGQSKARARERGQAKQTDEDLEPRHGTSVQQTDRSGHVLRDSQETWLPAPVDERCRA
jgi:hypothetical protein